MDDSYTMETRLCDDRGMVSRERRADYAPGQCETYLDLVNMWSRWTRYARDPEAEVEPIEEPYACTGHAHLIGEHIRCTSPAHGCGPVHVVPPEAIQLSVAATAADLDKLAAGHVVITDPDAAWARVGNGPLVPLRSIIVSRVPPPGPGTVDGGSASAA